MTRPPLAIRLRGPGIDQHLEHELVEALEFGSVMPGGYSSSSFAVHRALEDVPAELYPYTRVTVLDQRDGQTLHAGRLQVPGRGQPWKLTTAGPRSHAGDVKRPYVVIDSRMSEWERVDGYGGTPMPGAQVGTQGGAGEIPGLRHYFPRGLVVPVNGQATVRYPHLIPAGQRAARVDVSWTVGVQPVWVQQIQSLDATATGINSTSTIWATGSTQSMTVMFGAGFGTVTPIAMVDYRSLNGTGGTVGNDVTWALTSLLRIQAARYARDGSLLLTGGDYPNNYILPHEVVSDLLGRPGFLPQYDGVGASVSTASTVHLQQLAYSDGATPADVLDDLMDLDASMRWAAWEPNAAGLYRFTWDAWPTTVAWEVAADAGNFSSAGGDAELVDTLYVRWTDLRGRLQWSSYTHSVPLLTAAGVTRTDVIDLGSDAGSQTAADAAATKYFAEHQQPANNGTLDVSAPVYNRVIGRMEQPWELRAGNLIRVRNLAPSIDSLNATDRDGSSVFRVTKVTYKAASNTATLTLDSYSDTLYGALVRLTRRAAKVARRS